MIYKYQKWPLYVAATGIAFALFFGYGFNIEEEAFKGLFFGAFLAIAFLIIQFVSSGFNLSLEQSQGRIIMHTFFGRKEIDLMSLESIESITSFTRHQGKNGQNLIISKIIKFHTHDNVIRLSIESLQNRFVFYQQLLDNVHVNIKNELSDTPSWKPSFFDKKHLKDLGGNVFFDKIKTLISEKKLSEASAAALVKIYNKNKEIPETLKAYYLGQINCYHY